MDVPTRFIGTIVLSDVAVFRKFDVLLRKTLNYTLCRILQFCAMPYLQPIYHFIVKLDITVLIGMITA
jgi:hypothetical protein